LALLPLLLLSEVVQEAAGGRSGSPLSDQATATLLMKRIRPVPKEDVAEEVSLLQEEQQVSKPGQVVTPATGKEASAAAAVMAQKAMPGAGVASRTHSSLLASSASVRQSSDGGGKKDTDAEIQGAYVGLVDPVKVEASEIDRAEYKDEWDQEWKAGKSHRATTTKAPSNATESEKDRAGTTHIIGVGSSFWASFLLFSCLSQLLLMLTAPTSPQSGLALLLI